MLYTITVSFNIKLRCTFLPIMVETKEAHGAEPSGDKKVFSGEKAFKKNKGGHADKKNEAVPELLRGVSFSISRDGPDLYLKAVKRLGVYVCTTYKNRSNVQMCLVKEELILPEEPILLDKPTPHQRKMWDLRAAAAIKNQDSLKQNLKSLFTVVMSLCDSIMEDRVSCHKDYATIKCTRDTIKLLKIIKQIMYSNGAKEMHAVHNQVMATINLFKMHQERVQTPQNFRDQFTAMRQVCEQLGLQIGQTVQGAQAILKRKGVTNPTSEQLSEAKKQAAEEYHAKLFLYLTDQQRYGKAIEDMENNLLNKLDPFPKTVSEACRYLIKWHNNYG